MGCVFTVGKAKRRLGLGKGYWKNVKRQVSKILHAREDIAIELSKYHVIQ